MSHPTFKPPRALGDNPNSPTWKSEAEKLAAALAEEIEIRQELEARLNEIAGIAAPEEVAERLELAERLDRIEAALSQLAAPKPASVDPEPPKTLRD